MAGRFDFQVSVWPDKNQAGSATFPVTGMKPMDGVTSAQGQVIEVKIPLSAIKRQPSPLLPCPQTSNPGNAVGDMMENLNPMEGE